MNFIHFTVAMAFKKSDYIQNETDIYRILTDKLSLEYMLGADLYIKDCSEIALIDCDYLFVIDNIKLKKGKALYDKICMTPEIIANLSFKKPIYQHNELYSISDFRFLGTVQKSGELLPNDNDTEMIFRDIDDKKIACKKCICSFYIDDTYENAERLFRAQLNSNLEKLKEKYIYPFIVGNSLLSTNLMKILQCRNDFFEMENGNLIEYCIMPNGAVIIDHDDERIMHRLIQKCIELGFRQFVVDIRSKETDCFNDYIENNRVSFEIVNDENRSNYIFKAINFINVLHKSNYYFQFGDVNYAEKYVNFDSITFNLQNQNTVELYPIDINC